MEYLYLAGDDRFGALGVSTSPDNYQPRPASALPRLEDAQQLSDIVAKINAREQVSDMERRMMHAGGSFGGAKPKALIQIDGTQWVIKFFNGEPVDVPLIEHASMTLAAKAQIRVATTMPVRLAGEHAVAVQRYDRVGANRVHCISAGTALRAIAPSGHRPDFGYPHLAQLLRRAGDTRHDANRNDMAELFRRMVFNILIDNTDDHEKNHALMFTRHDREARMRLTPAYDVLPTNSGQGHQEFVVGDAAGDSTLANAMSQCEQFGLARDQAAQQVLQVIAVVDGWKEHFRVVGVSDGDVHSLAERLDVGDLGAQRVDFKPQNYKNKNTRRRQGPFA
jgi:serine/threonine-protein kinase HipA